MYEIKLSQVNATLAAYGIKIVADTGAEQPPVKPPEPPVTPPAQQTKEFGQLGAYATETNWHFSKPIASYGKFDLFVADKKYVIKGSYKDDDIEVRNSNSRGTLVVIAAPAAKSKKVYVAYPSSGTATAPPADPPPGDGDFVDVDYDDIVHHWNPGSFEDRTYPSGRCMTVVFCVREKYQGVTFTDAQDGTVTKFHLHNGNDEGREVWSSVDWSKKMPTHRAGTVVAVAKDGTKFRFTIPAGGKTYMDYKGKCFGKR